MKTAKEQQAIRDELVKNIEAIQTLMTKIQRGSAILPESPLLELLYAHTGSSMLMLSEAIKSIHQHGAHKLAALEAAAKAIPEGTPRCELCGLEAVRECLDEFQNRFVPVCNHDEFPCIADRPIGHEEAK